MRYVAVVDRGLLGSLVFSLSFSVFLPDFIFRCPLYRVLTFLYIDWWLFLCHTKIPPDSASGSGRLDIE